MGPTEVPQEPTEEPQERLEGSALRPSQRIAFATLARTAGEAFAKLASLVFFIVIARELGEDDFGDFIFGASLATVLLMGAGVGMEELISREVARDHRRVDELLWNILALKALILALVLAVIAVVVTIQGYSLETALAILVVSAGVGFEYEANALFAVFQGYERQQHVAASLIVNRVSTLALVVAVLLAGGGLLAVSTLYAVGSALGLGAAYLLMRRYVVHPRYEVDPGRWRRLLRTSIPLGLVAVLGVISLRSSVVLLGLLGGSSGEVGEYGAAFRLIEATLFVSWAFSGAVLPWFSRHPGSGRVSIAQGFEISLKAIVSIMLPLALGLALFAEPMIETLYGTEYDGAVEPLRLLAVMAVLVGVNGVVTAVLIARDRPRVYAVPAAVAITSMLVLSVILIPPHGVVGAALAAVLSGILLAVLTTVATVRLVGSISTPRIAVAPLLAGGLMAVAVVLLSGAPWIPAALVATLAYGAAFLAIERVFFPSDFAYYAGVTRLRRRGAAVEPIGP